VRCLKKKAPLPSPPTFFSVLVFVLDFDSALVLVLVLDYSCFYIPGFLFFCDGGCPGPRPAYCSWFLIFIVHVAEITVGCWDFQTDQDDGVIKCALNWRLIRHFNPQVRFSVPL
jgi:hypothetical protein